MARSTRQAALVAFIGATTTWSAAAAGLPPVDLLWHSEFFGPQQVGYDQAKAVARHPDGSLLVACEVTNSGFDSDLSVAKYSPDGSLLWMSSWDSPDGGNDYAVAMAVDPSGAIFVAGYSYGGPAGTTIAVVRFESNGVIGWARTHFYSAGGTFHNQAYAIAVDLDGDCVVAGSTGHFSTGSNAALLKIDGASGDLEWATQLSGTGPGWESGKCVVIDEDNEIFVAGEAVFANQDLCAWKCTAEGAVVWTRNFSGGPTSWGDGLQAATLGPDGSIYLAGWANVDGNAGDDDALVVRYDADGELLWSFAHAGSGLSQDRFFVLATDSEGNVIASGWENTSDQHDDFLTVKLSPEGDLLWLRSFGEAVAGADYAMHVEVDEASNILVIGPSTHLLGEGVGGGKGPPTESGYRLLSYRSDGALRYEHFHHPGDNHWMTAAGSLTGARPVIVGNLYFDDQIDFFVSLWQEGFDCDANGIPDASDIANRVLTDRNGDGVPDQCAAAGDLNGDGAVNGGDVTIILGAWGPGGPPADVTGDGTVDGADIAWILGNWTG